MIRNNMFDRAILTTGVFLFLGVFLIISGCSDNGGDSATDSITLPQLITGNVMEVTDSTAMCEGTVTSEGASDVTARGVCWSTSPSPNLSDNVNDEGGGSGAFISEITGLTSGTQYYVRAYATNGSGTSYGKTRTFTALITGTVTDIDGNTYRTVKIGDQWWMAENLKVTHYRSGAPINGFTSKREWREDSEGAYCYYNNSEGSTLAYGMLYNWYAVNNPAGLAPEGWHIPSDEEWKELEMNLGMSSVDANETGWRGTDQGGQMKTYDDPHWRIPNVGATNKSGFSAVPGGFRDRDAIYDGGGESAILWTSTDLGERSAWYRWIHYDGTTILRMGCHCRYGFSVRCVRDAE